MDKNNYDFPVELATLTAGETNIVIPKKFAVIRTDTNEPIGIVSNKYAVLRHAEVVEGFRSALEGQNYTEKIRVLKNGAQLFAEYTLKDVQQEVERNDVIGMKFTAKNSYDGSTELQMNLGAVRLVCTNGMVVTRNVVEFSHKHIGNSIHLDVAEVRKNFAIMVGRFEQTIPHMQQMSRTKIDIAMDQLFDPEKIKLPAYLLKEAELEYKKAGDKTVWGHYNALTFAITHKIRNEDSVELQNQYGALAWDVASKELELA